MADCYFHPCPFHALDPPLTAIGKSTSLEARACSYRSRPAHFQIIIDPAFSSTANQSVRAVEKKVLLFRCQTDRGKLVVRLAIVMF